MTRFLAIRPFGMSRAELVQKALPTVPRTYEQALLLAYLEALERAVEGARHFLGEAGEPFLRLGDSLAALDGLRPDRAPPAPKEPADG